MSYCVTQYVYLCHRNVHLHNWGRLVLYTIELQGQKWFGESWLGYYIYVVTISYTLQYVFRNIWIHISKFLIVISLYIYTGFIIVKKIDKWRVYRLSDYKLIKYSSLHSFIRLKWENHFCSCKVHFINNHDQTWKFNLIRYIGVCKQ